jgi:hypothetical protein
MWSNDRTRIVSFPAHDQSCKVLADPEFAGNVQKWENIPVSIGFRWCGYDAVARYPLGSHLYCGFVEILPHIVGCIGGSISSRGHSREYLHTNIPCP